MATFICYSKFEINDWVINIPNVTPHPDDNYKGKIVAIKFIHKSGFRRDAYMTYYLVELEEYVGYEHDDYRWLFEESLILYNK